MFRFLQLIVLISFFGCNGSNTNDKIERDNEPTIYSVDGDDLEMNEAIDNAQKTLHKFDTALESKNPNFHNFSLKTRFKTSDGYEHMWLSDIFIKGNKHFGVIDNLPEFTNEIKIGDTVQLPNEEISDWMYIEDQKLYGGFTIRLLRKRMTESERKLFDEENGLIIEN